MLVLVHLLDVHYVLCILMNTNKVTVDVDMIMHCDRILILVVVDFGFLLSLVHFFVAL